MRLAITGGGGFLGVRLARRLLAEPAISIAGSPRTTIDELLLLDRVAPPPDLAAHAAVRVGTGELDRLIADGALDGADVVVHLAAVVSGEAERDFDLGLRVNLDLGRAVFEAGRHQAEPPVVVFASSVAVFGVAPPEAGAEPVVIADDTLPTPLNSYGTQKFVCEQLLADYTRKGFVRGRSLRLMTVTVRPGRPNAAASSFVSGIIREPLAGERSVCPVPLDTELAVSSPVKTIDGLVAGIATDDDRWGPRTALNLPPITVTPAQMLAAMDRVAATRGIGDGAPSELVDLAADPAVAAVVTSWPSRFAAVRAAGLGLLPETSFDDVVASYLDAE